MSHIIKILLLTICIATSSLAYENSDIVSARIETCRGCSLNRLPEVKNFVMEDAPFYERLEVQFITGAPPILIILGENDNELERIALSKLNRVECNDILLQKGFNKKNKKEEF
ncbi:selenoprotein M-like [Vanessa atalanta]|uniref:selenoprotein M-like n=1 Tax=Vanessa atalanta TaxID=42275 RepID=UPI001FCD8C2D|nr:selenoprotein M-like [Vanessa atalanta]